VTGCRRIRREGKCGSCERREWWHQEARGGQKKVAMFGPEERQDWPK